MSNWTADLVPNSGFFLSKEAAPNELFQCSPGRMSTICCLPCDLKSAVPSSPGFAQPPSAHFHTPCFSLEEVTTRSSNGFVTRLFSFAVPPEWNGHPYTPPPFFPFWYLGLNFKLVPLGIPMNIFYLKWRPLSPLP